ncbi:hypothetical protein [Streptomyces sp. SLBN-8D4]|jgi:hypothetical protein|uniref:hypothetical protein n=1 Tax=Streptomyces sp. SLBN-8D4 TaxID=3377728 RepID=UPI003C7DAC69
MAVSSPDGSAPASWVTTTTVLPASTSLPAAGVLDVTNASDAWEYPVATLTWRPSAHGSGLGAALDLGRVPQLQVLLGQQIPGLAHCCR